MAPEDYCHTSLLKKEKNTKNYRMILLLVGTVDLAKTLAKGNFTVSHHDTMQSQLPF